MTTSTEENALGDLAANGVEGIVPGNQMRDFDILAFDMMKVHTDRRKAKATVNAGLRFEVGDKLATGADSFAA